MKKIKVLVGGCFNRIHPGHVYFFNEAKKLGDELVVVLCNDANNKKTFKTPASDRVAMLKELKMIDKIIIGDANDFSKVYHKEKPDLIVLGYDQSMPDIIPTEGKGMIIKVRRIEKYKNYHTCIV